MSVGAFDISLEVFFYPLAQAILSSLQIVFFFYQVLDLGYGTMNAFQHMGQAVALVRGTFQRCLYVGFCLLLGLNLTVQACNQSLSLHLRNVRAVRAVENVIRGIESGGLLYVHASVGVDYRLLVVAVSGDDLTAKVKIVGVCAVGVAAVTVGFLSEQAVVDKVVVDVGVHVSPSASEANVDILAGDYPAFGTDVQRVVHSLLQFSALCCERSQCIVLGIGFLAQIVHGILHEGDLHVLSRLNVSVQVEVVVHRQVQLGIGLGIRTCVLDLDVGVGPEVSV